MINRFAAVILVCVAALVVSGCTHNILVTKNGESYFLATKQKGLKKMLCDSGDMTAILHDAQLRPELEASLYGNICAEKTDRDKVMEILSDMTKEERERLKLSFNRNGYDVNFLIC